MFILSNRYLRQIKLCLGYFLKLKYFSKNGTFFVTCDKNRDKENDTHKYNKRRGNCQTVEHILLRRELYESATQSEKQKSQKTRCVAS